VASSAPNARKTTQGKKCLAGLTSCFSCGEEGHIKTNYPKGKKTPLVKSLEKIVFF